MIIFDSVGDLDEIDPSVCQVLPLCQCHGDGTRGRCDLYVHSGRRRPGERDTSQNEEGMFPVLGHRYNGIEEILF